MKGAEKMTGVKFSYPFTKEMTATYIGYLLLCNLSAESINCYLSGLRRAHLKRAQLPGSLRTEFTSALIRAGLSIQISVWGGDLSPPIGGELACDSRQSRELKKLGFQMLKKRLFVKQNHFIG